MRVNQYIDYEKKQLELTITGDGSAEEALLYMLYSNGVKPIFERSSVQPLMVTIKIPIPQGK
jgi:hypothetical protein